MENDGKQLFEEFAEQLCQWAKTGKAAAAGSQDINYGLALQKERLDRHQCNMEYILKLRGEWLDRISEFTMPFSHSNYTSHLVSRSYQKTVNYFKDGQKRLTTKDYEELYAIITWLNQGEVQEAYCCPNCGAMSKIQVLTEGCQSCGTRFLISELFPKVTEFHFLKAYGMNNKEVKTRVGRKAAIGAFVGLLLVAPDVLADFVQGDGLVGKTLYAVLRLGVSGGVGAAAGYVVWAVGMLGGMFRDFFRMLPAATGIMNARNCLDAFMKRNQMEFSFEYFVGTVQALLKILIFTDDRRNLAVYEGAMEDPMFDDIIDAQFEGGIRLNGCRVEGDYCYIDLNVYMKDVYCQNNRVYQKRDVFQMGLCKNIHKPVDSGFSIKKVSCQSCGASFDASKEKHCPFCGTGYELKEDNWVITSIRKK